MATATGGDVMVRMLQEFRELQEESKEQFARTEKALRTVHMKCRVLFRATQRMSERSHDLKEQVGAFSQRVSAFAQDVGALAQDVGALAQDVGTLGQDVGTCMQQVRVFDAELNEFRDNMGELTTHVSTLTQEVYGIKTAQTRMFGQMGRMVHHLADAQASDRKRIDVLEERMDDPGEN
ncbi:hypothetical protein [Corallococcus carmarthensis]|uniref:Chemotaxis protein n=1 Tax=Corallococcus carmarthensis TaxID=2316728 RepID=A0A3A8JW96_9BACT|nr:hypothetical protein [Corallococcus carmarthensis]RKG99505.1 hypothetical protein D7X32_26290 [Corallococcus carmarthensis]